MLYVLAKALANPPHAEEGAGTAAGLNYFEMQDKDLIINLCIISLESEAGQQCPAVGKAAALAIPHQ